MIKYVPFLKAKQNEIIAVGSLRSDIGSQICPLFDFPRKGGAGYSSADLANSMRKTARSFSLHLTGLSELYVDCYDLDESLQPDGKHCYRFLLEQLTDLPVIPVVSLDRSNQHVEAVIDLKRQGLLNSRTCAYRVTPEDFESYAAVSNNIDAMLAPAFSEFEAIDLLLDCRLCRNLEASIIGQQALSFSQEFCQQYTVRRVIIAGSSIPASVSDILGVNRELVLERNEIAIFRAVAAGHNHSELIFGDYTTVSPNYSDAGISPLMLQNVMTAKLVYSFGDSHYFIRGGSLKTVGRSQYSLMAQRICQKDFFRGDTYSAGEQFLYSKSQSRGSGCTPSTVIKPSIVSHITYVVNELQY
jgi:hypothetical protein